MFGNIADAVRQIKSDVAHALDAALVVRLCRQLGHRWRERELDPVTTVQGFLLQVLHGNMRTHDMAQASMLHADRQR